MTVVSPVKARSTSAARSMNCIQESPRHPGVPAELEDRVFAVLSALVIPDVVEELEDILDLVQTDEPT